MRHLIRSIKYCIMLIVILLAITFLMNFTGSLDVTFAEQMALFVENDGVRKIIFFAVIAALYPLFGFVKRGVDGNIIDNHDQIIVAMEASGFTLKGQSEGQMKFGANTIFRRIAFLFEDSIVVSQKGDKILFEGPRRGVVYVTFMLEGFIKNSQKRV